MAAGRFLTITTSTDLVRIAPDRVVYISSIRIGKSLIINRNYVYYINIPKQKLTLSDAATFSHTVVASKEALKQLKELLEKEASSL